MAPQLASDERADRRCRGHEEPLDLLLTLARQQKVDLAKISIHRLPISTWSSSSRRGACA
jgi:hypothetical protein